MMTTLTLSDRTVSSLPLAKGKQLLVRDAELPGFFVMVGARTKTFMVQADLRGTRNRQSIRMKIGIAGRMTARDARAKAKKALGEIAEGIDPRPKDETAIIAAIKAREPTLRSAWNSYCESHLRRKGRSEKTISGCRDHIERLLGDWLDCKLSEFGDDPSLVKERHDLLTKENGPYIANGCMRTFRAIYTHARKASRSLPAENPVFAIDWNPEKRRDTGMGLEDLPGWFEQVRALDNPVRRELHLFILLSGSRPDAIKKVRVEHIDWAKRVVFIPSPKGGQDKAFCIPLSRQMICCMARARRFGRMMHPEQAADWLFPAESGPGHINEHKEDRADLSHWGNDLRQTYRTIGQIAEVNEVDMHLLMNHSLPGVNAGYITRAKLVGTHLRQAQQLISDRMFESIADQESGPWVWPIGSGKALLHNELPVRLDTARGKAAQKCSRNMAVFRASGR
jgi:integrase